MLGLKYLDVRMPKSINNELKYNGLEGPQIFLMKYRRWTRENSSYCNIEILKYHMEGRALIWYEEKYAEKGRPTCWSEFEEDIYDKFGEEFHEED